MRFACTTLGVRSTHRHTCMIIVNSNSGARGRSNMTNRSAPSHLHISHNSTSRDNQSCQSNRQHRVLTSTHVNTRVLQILCKSVTQDSRTIICTGCHSSPAAACAHIKINLIKKNIYQKQTRSQTDNNTREKSCPQYMHPYSSVHNTIHQYNAIKVHISRSESGTRPSAGAEPNRQPTAVS